MTHVIELPLLHDHHSHPSLYAALEGVPSLLGLPPGQAIELLVSQPRDRLGLVKGWRTDRLPLGPRDLEALPPLVIVNFSLHGYALTPAAIPFLEAGAATLGSFALEFAQHYGDRLWAERNLPRLFVLYGKIAGLGAEKLDAYMRALEAVGIGSVEDMTTAGSAALAVIASSPYRNRIGSWATPEVFAELSPEERASLLGVKLFLDGSLGARTAALGMCFLGGEKGFLVYTEEKLEEMLGYIADAGAGLSLHAIGALAIEEALVVFERSLRNGLRFPRARLEHVQFIRRDQAVRARELGLVLSMQPNFGSDSIDYRDRLPRGLVEQNNPFRMLIDEAGFVPGRDLLFGSDGMPHGLDCACAQGLFPAVPGQALSAEELVAGHGPAWGAEAPSPTLRLVIDDEARSVRIADAPRTQG